MAFMFAALLAALVTPCICALLLKYIVFIAFKAGVDPGLLTLAVCLASIANNCGSKRSG